MEHFKGVICTALMTTMLLAGYYFAAGFLGEAHDGAVLVSCSANMNQIKKGMQDYANDHGGAYPVNLSTQLSGQYLQDPKIFQCPYKQKLTRMRARRASIALILVLSVFLGGFLTVREDGFSFVSAIVISILLLFLAPAFTVMFIKPSQAETIDYVIVQPAAPGAMPGIEDKSENHANPAF